VPRYRVRLPESFTGAFSLSRQLAPSVPHLSGLSPTSHSRVFNCRLFYTMSVELSIAVYWPLSARGSSPTRWAGLPPTANRGWPAIHSPRHAHHHATPTTTPRPPTTPRPRGAMLQQSTRPIGGALPLLFVRAHDERKENGPRHIKWPRAWTVAMTIYVRPDARHQTSRMVHAACPG